MSRSSVRMMLLTATGFGVMPIVAAADPSGSAIINDEKPIPISNTNPGELLGNMVWVMVALAIVIVLILYVIKWLSKRNQLWGVNRSMRSLGGISLGQNSSLQVVEIADRIYIVGVGQTITLLDKLDNPDDVEAVLASLDRQPENVWNAKDLTGLIKKWRNRTNTQTETSSEQWNSPSSFQQMLDSKLSKGADRKKQLESLLQDHTKNERLMDDEK
ncbi:flagellar biosynthetic protein FliO [Paenibacillus sp. L3-i20]|uniref:flagellar biosynthetic protein FliO n=1 Tax=Paenibacillus sp. L3-i20 TaxID=2905833 RepID=UPI001EDCABA7|nr:flagellar biosynthetic protein FliO [Paenibacillus sp. L3-i20]